MASREAGFTLIETLIALAIVATAVASLQQGLGAGWKGLRMAGAELAAVEHARAELAAAGIVTPLKEGTRSGVTSDGYRWEVAIARSVSGSDGDDSRKPADRTRTLSAPRLVGYWVTATVRWQANSGLAPDRAVVLRTLKIGAPPR